MSRRVPSPSVVALAAAMVCAPGAVWSQSVLPPNPATQMPPASPSPAPAANPAAPAVAPVQGTQITAEPPRTHGQHAYVSYEGGLLNVRANDSSLNVILREIADKTGMKISGGVADQRVFGEYGPADPGVVLATLLDGTGVNVFLHGKRGDQPAELILTPRTGGPTPPSPGSSSFDAEAAAEALPSVTVPPRQPGIVLPQPPPRPSGPPPNAANTPNAVNATPVPAPSTSNGTTPVPDPNASPVTPAQTSPQPMNNVNGSPNNTTPTPTTMPTVNSVPTSTLSAPSTAQPSATGIVDSTNAPPAGTTTNPVGSSTTATTTAPDGTTSTTTTTSPNGVKTPDEIYQQLLKIQQQRSGTAASSETTTGGGNTTNPQQNTNPQP